MVAPRITDGEDPFVRVVDVLALIAHGRADGFRDAPPSRVSARWGGDLDPALNGDPKAQPFVRGIRRLLIRDRWWRTRKGRPCPVPPLTPVRRAQVRAAWHRHGRTPLRTLLSDLLEVIASTVP